MTALCVLTSETRDKILREGGTRDWKLDATNAAQQQFIVCIHRYAEPKNPDRGHSAFLVGKLMDVQPSEQQGLTGRWKLIFSEFADIEIPNAWPLGNRNPVLYTSLEQLGINFLQLQFQPMPTPVSTIQIIPPTISTQKIKPLSISEAKLGLASTFGVTPADIEIIIRG